MSKSKSMSKSRNDKVTDKVTDKVVAWERSWLLFVVSCFERMQAEGLSDP